MAVCEKCWGDAYGRMRSAPLKCQAEHYQELVKERADQPCTKAEQAFGRNCCLLETEDKYIMTEQINKAIARFAK